MTDQLKAAQRTYDLLVHVSYAIASFLEARFQEDLDAINLPNSLDVRVMPTGETVATAEAYLRSVFAECTAHIRKVNGAKPN